MDLLRTTEAVSTCSLSCARAAALCKIKLQTEKETGLQLVLTKCFSHVFYRIVGLIYEHTHINVASMQ